MYEVSKSMEVSGSHQLSLTYPSKCTNLHGHNWRITVYVRSNELNENGMVIDFTEIKEIVHDKLDHKHLNDIVDFNPTAENLCKWVADEINTLRPGIRCVKVEIQETTGNTCTWWED